MKFGVLQFFSWSRRVPLATVYDRALQRIEVMDQSGYDAVWLAEHHFNTYSVCPSVTVMATHVAARTKRIRIGTAVTLSAFYHPLRLAEELALVDNLSNGRLNWGAGRGFDATEFRTFKVPVEESSDRFREAVEVVLAAWRNERLAFEGKFWQFDNVEVLPKPLQQPHPPVWLAATSPESIKRAAADGYTILMDPHASHADIATKRKLYFDELTKHGHSTENREIPTARLLAIADTEREAEDVAREGARWTVGSYAKQPIGGVGRPEEQVDPVERYVRDVIVYGTPESVTDKLLELRDEVGIDYLMASPLSHRTFELFTEKVLPRLA